MPEKSSYTTLAEEFRSRSGAPSWHDLVQSPSLLRSFPDGTTPPELEALRDTQQDPEHHPEGDALNHTVLAAEQASRLVEDWPFVGLIPAVNKEDFTGLAAPSDHDKAVIILAAICHDLGKATTTELRTVNAPDGSVRQKWTSHGHQDVVEPARSLLTRWRVPEAVQEQVIPLIRTHMWTVTSGVGPNAEPGGKQIQELLAKIKPATFSQWAAVVAADDGARGEKKPVGRELKWAQGYLRWLNGAAERKAEAERQRRIKPLIGARELMADFGVPEGPEVGRVLAYIKSERSLNEKMTREEEAKCIEKFLKTEKKVGEAPTLTEQAAQPGTPIQASGKAEPTEQDWHEVLRLARNFQPRECKIGDCGDISTEFANAVNKRLGKRLVSLNYGIVEFTEPRLTRDSLDKEDLAGMKAAGLSPEIPRDREAYFRSLPEEKQDEWRFTTHVWPEVGGKIVDPGWRMFEDWLGEGEALRYHAIPPKTYMGGWTGIWRHYLAHQGEGRVGEMQGEIITEERDPTQEPTQMNPSKGHQPTPYQFVAEGSDTAIVIRPEGWGASNDALREWTKPGHLYRGMTGAEYEATVGAGKGVISRQDFSVRGEGTSFAEDAETAESYVNSGRDDPRVTGKANYLVEIRKTEDIKRTRDGYYKSAKAVPMNQITRIWKMYARGGEVVAEEVGEGRIFEEAGQADSTDPAGEELARFAMQVNASAKHCKTGRFGEKVFINHVYKHHQAAFGATDRMGLPEFKKALTQANHEGLVRLARADLVAAMPPADVRESEIKYLNATFHFVRVPG